MFTNEDMKQFKDCTEEEQLEIFKAFWEGRTQFWNECFEEWQENTILNPIKIYRVIRPKEEDSSERATPIKGIPWEVIDRKWNWAAMDMDGCICLYDNKPRRLSENWAYAGTEDDYFYVQGYFKLDMTGVEWTTSLTKRPEYC